MRITEEIAKEMLNSGNDLLVKTAKEAFPNLVKTNFQIACEALGISDVIPEGLSKSTRALFQLEVIIAYKNEGWKPDFNNKNQCKYYPWFELVNGEQVLSVVRNYFSSALVPAPTLFKSRELCEETVKENMDLYNDYIQML